MEPVNTKTQKLAKHRKVLLKGTGQYWYLLKIIISIKAYLVLMSSGEQLIV